MYDGHLHTSGMVHDCKEIAVIINR